MADLHGLMRQYGYYDDGVFQPDVARMMLAAAKTYLKNAGVPEPEVPNPLYDLACYMLAAHWYDNRGVVLVGQVQGEIAKGVQAIIWQLGGADDAADG